MFGEGFRCPYGESGGRLWVRETYRHFDDGDTFFKADFVQFGDDYVPVHADDEPEDWKWQHAMFMPRERSRLTLELTDISIQRLQDITINNIYAEGIRPSLDAVRSTESMDAICVGMFRHVWDELNLKRGFPWKSNPWVWKLCFRRL